MTGKSWSFPDAFMWALGAACVLAGCSQRPPAPEGAIWIEGGVRYHAQPVPRGVVQFFATDGNASGAARIREGHFGGYLRPGRYAVAVIAPQTPAQENERGQYVPATSLIPDRYGDIATSSLVVDVNAAHDRVEFDLTP